MSKDQRKKLLVDLGLQGKLAWRICVHWIAFFAVSMSLTTLFHFLSEPTRPISTHLTNVLVTHRVFLLVSMIMVPTFVYDSLQISNRFAGPILRFRRFIGEIGYGRKVEPLKFRDGDFWHDLSSDLNDMLQRIDSEPNSGSVGPVSDERELQEVS